jgi:N-acyl homoserine lactone hydrolase
VLYTIGEAGDIETDKAQSIASMEKIRRMIATYKATFFINRYKEQTDTLKIVPAFYD